MDSVLEVIPCTAHGTITFSVLHLGYDKNASGVIYRLDSNIVYAVKNYANQGNVASAPGPSGTRIVFGSDWGGSNTLDTFVAELPAYTISIVLHKTKFPKSHNQAFLPSTKHYRLNGSVNSGDGKLLQVIKMNNKIRNVFKMDP
jgi:hypothetical protein